MFIFTIVSDEETNEAYKKKIIVYKLLKLRVFYKIKAYP